MKLSEWDTAPTPGQWTTIKKTGSSERARETLKALAAQVGMTSEKFLKITKAEQELEDKLWVEQRRDEHREPKRAAVRAAITSIKPGLVDAILARDHG